LITGPNHTTREDKMITIDTEKAMIHGANGSAMYSIVDGFVDIYDDAGELTEAELTAACKLLEELIDNE